MVDMENNVGHFNPITRFNLRAELYDKYRPDYPEELFTFLERELGLNKGSTLVEIGSGTGVFSKHLIGKGYFLTCIEPNSEMRQKSIEKLVKIGLVKIIDGFSENTGLEKDSVDCIFVAQAFHWFNSIKTKIEFQRILKANGKIVICWILNKTRTEFERNFESLRNEFANKPVPKVRNDEAKIRDFFSPNKVAKKVFHFTSSLDLENLKGILLSTSFLPQEGEEGHLELLKKITELFQKYQKNGYVQLGYQVPLYWSSI